MLSRTQTSWLEVASLFPLGVLRSGASAKKRDGSEMFGDTKGPFAPQRRPDTKIKEKAALADFKHTPIEGWTSDAYVIWTNATGLPSNLVGAVEKLVNVRGGGDVGARWAILLFSVLQKETRPLVVQYLEQNGVPYTTATWFVLTMKTVVYSVAYDMEEVEANLDKVASALVILLFEMKPNPQELRRDIATGKAVVDCTKVLHQRH